MKVDGILFGLIKFSYKLNTCSILVIACMCLLYCQYKKAKIFKPSKQTIAKLKRSVSNSRIKGVNSPYK